MKKNIFNTIVNILYIIICYAILISFLYITGLYGNKNFSISILSILIYGFIVYVIFNYLKFKYKKRDIIFILISSLLLACSSVYGYNLENKSTIGLQYLSTHIYIVCLTLFFYSLINFIRDKFKVFYKCIEIKIDIKFLDKILYNNKTFFKCLILILLAWLPIFLAFFPGIFSYDAPYQFSDIYYWVFSSGNPIIHTLIIGATLNLGHIIFNNYNIGIVFYSILQMTILASTLSYIITYLNNKKANIYLKTTSLLLFMFLPTHALMSIITTKDVMFSCFTVLFFTKILDLLCFTSEFNNKKNWNTIVTILFAFLVLIFRPNGLYGFVFLSLFLIIYEKKRLKLILLIVLIPLLMYKIYSYGISFLSGVDTPKKGISPIYIVPIQQIGRLYNSNLLTNAEKRELNAMFTSENNIYPLKQYKNHIYDPISRITDNDVLYKNLPKFRRMWIKYLFKYPLIYIDAFFDNSISYWYLADKYPDDSYYYRYRPYLEVYTEDRDHHTQNQIKNDTKLPKLYQTYKSYIEDGRYQYIPLLSLLMSNALYNILLILLAFYFIIQKKWNKFIPIIFLLCLVATNFLGPVSLTRYCYYLYMCFPILIFIISSSTTKNKI